MGEPFILDLVSERLSRSLLTAFRFWLEFRKSLFWHFFDFFSVLNINDEMYLRQTVRMAVDVIFHYLHRCRFHMSSFSHMAFGLRIMYLMWWIQRRPHLTNQAAVRPNWNAKVCTTRGMNSCSFHIAFCHKSRNVVCFVVPSCCTTAGSDPIATLFVHFMVTYIK